MAFKMKGFSGFSDFRKKIKTARAKRLIRKYVEGVVHPDFGGIKHATEKDARKPEKKMIKADRLLKEAGYNFGKREEATGATGIKDALEFAQSKRNKRKRKNK